MQSVAQALQQGLEHHQRGQWPQAETLYRQVLEADANRADAWHLLGLVTHAQGDVDKALEYLDRAIRLDGGQPVYHLNLAEAYRSVRRLSEAEESCRQALRLSENFAAAHNTLGVVLHQQGRVEEAAACFRRAIAADARFALPHANLAMSLHALGRLDEALAACREALARDPSIVLAYQELGRILREQGKAAEAIDFFRQTLRAHPKLAAVECCLGVALQAESRLDEAAESFRRALAIEPNDADAHCHLGTVLDALGQGREAADSYHRALACNPRLAEAHYNLGAWLQGRGHQDAALRCYENAVRLKPDCAPAYNNLGVIHQGRGDLARSSQYFAKALEFKPNFAEALNNLGNALKVEGRIAEARVCYHQALKTLPDSAQARCNLALLNLAEGDFAAGWPEYECRRGCPEYRRRAFDQPEWNGEPLSGRRLLVHAEQGLGDTLQFARYLPLVVRRGGTVIFEVQPSLIPLLKQSPIARAAQLAARDDPLPEFDLYVPLLSLPRIFGTTIADIPAAAGYLRADPRWVAHWRGVLGDAPPRRIGIAWQGSPAYRLDRFRSIPLAEFAPLALPGVELVSLQKGPGAEQVAGAGFPVRDLGADFDESHGAFVDTAAVMKNLDLVVTSDTATAHLAGALGVETWVALPMVPDWRWMYQRADSPWYASMRLFRQTRLGDWPGLFARLADALREFLAGR